MVKFERRDPFPLLPLGSFSKSEALDHADEVDGWLGLRTQEIERSLAATGSRKPAPHSSGHHQQLWFGLEPRDLQTPYLELRAILDSLLPDSNTHMRIADLGCAYARMAFIVERHHPNAIFEGYEFVGERVTEARRVLALHQAKRSTIEHVDLTACALPKADIYFLYDFGTPAAIEQALHSLKKESRHRPLTIVARGRTCRYAIDSRHAWLSKEEGPERAFTVYRSRPEVSVQDFVRRIESPV